MLAPTLEANDSTRQYHHLIDAGPSSRLSVTGEPQQSYLQLPSLDGSEPDLSADRSPFKAAHSGSTVAVLSSKPPSLDFSSPESAPPNPITSKGQTPITLAVHSTSILASLPSSEQHLNLVPPPLALSSHFISLSFSSTLHLSTPTSIPASSYRTLLLLPSSSIKLTLAFTLNYVQLPPSSPLAERLSLALSRAPLWGQLSFRPSLSVPASPSSQTFLTLRRSTACDAILSPCSEGRVLGCTFDFDYSGSINSEYEYKEASELMEIAVRSFWGDKMASIAPVVGKPGLGEEIEGRRVAVENVAEVLKRRFGGGGEIERKLWGRVVGEVKTKEGLMRAIGEDEEGWRIGEERILEEKQVSDVEEMLGWEDGSEEMIGWSDEQSGDESLIRSDNEDDLVWGNGGEDGETMLM